MKSLWIDGYYAIEVILMCAIPFSLIFIGFALRRKFRAPGAKTGYFLGSALFWTGILAVLFSAVVILNFLGVL